MILIQIGTSSSLLECVRELELAKTINTIDGVQAHRVNAVAAIKAVHAAYGFDLKQSKDLVDLVVDNLKHHG